MTTEVSFAEAVAQRAGCSAAEAVSVLAEHSVPTAASAAKPHRLRVTRLVFSGEKSGVDEGPFVFEQDFGDGLWALVSERNEAGKTSVFEIMVWALRGTPREELQADVRAWAQHVELQGLIDDEPFQVEFDVRDGVPAGLLRCDDGERAFTSHEGFSDVMSSFMLDRLGLATFTNWVKDQGRQTHGWPSYTGGLYLPRESLAVVLGDIAQAGLPGRLLLMFVGVPWAQTLAAAQTAVRAEREGHRKVASAEDALRQRATAELEQLVSRRDDALARLAAAPEIGELLADVDSAAANWMALVSDCARLEEALVAAERNRKFAASAAMGERKRLADLSEARIAQRLFHAMNPTHCPRCSTAIDDDRRATENVTGHCAVCAREIGDAEEVVQVGVVSAAEADEEQYGLDTLEDLLNRLDEEAAVSAERVLSIRAELQQREGDRDAAQRRLEELRAHTSSMEERLRAELEVAQLQARVEQLESLVQMGHARPGEEDRPQVLAVLQAAEVEATERVERGFQTVLDALNREILELGQKFGIDSLQSITINRATHIRVGKGGSVTSFSACTPGERLRLRIAVVIALLRVAAAHGVGRHPGLLLIDSIGAEETESGDLAEFMRHLVEVTDALGIETIVASARTEILDHVPAEHVRVALGREYLW